LEHVENLRLEFLQFGIVIPCLIASFRQVNRFPVRFYTELQMQTHKLLRGSFSAFGHDSQKQQ
jgi:hypothetical protein